MLQKNAVPRAAMDVLNFLSAKDFLKDYRLVGGTSLALLWGHRHSVDIDLFSDKNYPLIELEQQLSLIEGASLTGKNPIGLAYVIKGVKCDFLNYPYKFFHPEITEDGIRMAHVEDIIALKLGAIANRGARKDFIDLYYILEKYQLKDLLHFYTRMYNVSEHFSLLKSMIYFEDAEMETTPTLLIEPNLAWDKIKKTIIQKVSKAL